MVLIVVRDDDHFRELLQQNSSKTVIIDFTATWCGPCKHIAPLFEHLSNEYSSLVFLKVDVDVCTDAADDVAAMPTFRVIKNGEKVDEFKGANEEKLTELVKKHA